MYACIGIHTHTQTCNFFSEKKLQTAGKNEWSSLDESVSELKV